MKIQVIGKRIRKYRLIHGYSQKKFSEMTDITPNYLSAVERGVKVPSLATFIRIANALNVTADELSKEEPDATEILRCSPFNHKIEQLPDKEINKIMKVVEVMLQNAEL